MDRAEVFAAYTVSKGRITSPGQFEGQAVYLPHYWALYLEGFADRDNGKELGFDVTPGDRIEFPELGRKHTVRLVQDDQGFVVET